MKLVGSKIADEVDGGIGNTHMRFHAYWISSVLSILVFLLLMYWAAMLQFPPGQFPLVVGLLICTISAILSGVSLLIGFWKFRTSDAPAIKWPSGPLLCIPLVLELGLSIIGIIQMMGRIFF